MQPTPARTIRVLCVDDHPIVRDGVIGKIDLEPDMQVVASASSGEEAVQLFELHRPDVTLMDLNLPRMTGIEAITAIRAVDPHALVVVLTMYKGDQDIHRAMTRGAAGYVIKTALSEDLITVIRQVIAGARTVPADVARQSPSGGTSGVLTPREVVVVKLMARGLQNKEIAASMGITPLTVEVHARNLFLKLGVQGRTDAVMVCLKRGIIQLPGV